MPHFGRYKGEMVYWVKSYTIMGKSCMIRTWWMAFSLPDGRQGRVITHNGRLRHGCLVLTNAKHSTEQPALTDRCIYKSHRAAIPGKNQGFELSKE